MKHVFIPLFVGSSLLASCSTMDKPYDPTAEEKFALAKQRCPLQITPLAELSEYITQCDAEGISAVDTLASIKCGMSKLKKEKPQLISQYPALMQIEVTAKVVPSTSSPTTPEYQAASQNILEMLGKLTDQLITKNPYPMTKCYNDALLTYLAPKSASPAAVQEFAAHNEEIALREQQGKLSSTEAGIEFQKATATLKLKLESAKLQQRQLQLMESQNQAARAMALQQALSNYQQSITPPAPPPPVFRNTNCHVFGNNLNCTSF